MPYSDQQIADYAHQLEAKGAPSSDIETFISSAKSEQTTSSPPATPQAQSSPVTSPPATDSTGAGGKIAGGILDALNPANLEKNLSTAAQGGAALLKNAQQNNVGGFGTMQNQQATQEQEQKDQQNVKAMQQAGNDANSAGIVPPSMITDQTTGQQRMPTPQETEASINPLQRIVSAGNEIANAPSQAGQAAGQQAAEGIKQGAGQIYQAGGSDELGGAISGVDSQGQQLDPTQRVMAGGKAAADVVSGTLKSLFAIPGSIVNQVPGGQQVTGFLNDKLSQGSTAAGNAFMGTMGIDPNSDQGKILAQHFQNLGQLFATKAAEDTAGAMNDQNALSDAQDAVQKAKASGDMNAANAAQDALEKLQANQKAPTITGNAGANILKGAQTVAGNINPFLKSAADFLLPPNAKAPNVEGGAPQSGTTSGFNVPPESVNSYKAITEDPTAKTYTAEDLPNNSQGSKQDLLRANVSEQNSNLLKNLPDNLKQSAVNYLQEGLNRLENPTKGGTLFDMPGKEIEDFMKSAKTMKSQLGQAVSDAKDNLVGLQVSPDQIQNVKSVFENQLKKLNIKQTIDPDTGLKILDHSESDLGDGGGASAKLDQIYNKLNSQKLDARGLEAMTSQIDQATGLAKTSGYKGNTLNTALTNVKSAINSAVGDVSTEFKDANTKFAKFINDYQDVYNASKVPLNNGKFVTKGAQVLRRILGNADAKPLNAIQSIANLSNNFGLQMPTDLVTKAHLADMAEKYTGNIQSQSLSGGIEKGVEAAQGTSGVVGDMIKGAKAVKDYIAPPEAIKANATKLIKLIQASMRS